MLHAKQTNAPFQPGPSAGSQYAAGRFEATGGQNDLPGSKGTLLVPLLTPTGGQIHSECSLQPTSAAVFNDKTHGEIWALELITTVGVEQT